MAGRAGGRRGGARRGGAGRRPRDRHDAGASGGERRIVAGLHPVRELLRAGATVDELHVADARGGSEVLAEIERLAEAAGVAPGTADQDTLDRLTGGVAHQGVVAVAPPYRYRTARELVEAVPAGEPPLLVALDGVTDPHNLGSVARTAEAVGAHGVLVPQRRAAGVGPAAEKAAAGALAHLAVAQVTNLTRTLEELGDAGIWSVGLDAAGTTELHRCGLLSEPVVLVVGSEGAGLSRLVARSCDELVALPMRGRVGSLNASVAAAVSLYEALRQRSGG